MSETHRAGLGSHYSGEAALCQILRRTGLSCLAVEALALHFANMRGAVGEEEALGRWLCRVGVRVGTYDVLAASDDAMANSTQPRCAQQEREHVSSLNCASHGCRLRPEGQSTVGSRPHVAPWIHGCRPYSHSRALAVELDLSARILHGNRCMPCWTRDGRCPLPSAVALPARTCSVCVGADVSPCWQAAVKVSVFPRMGMGSAPPGVPSWLPLDMGHPRWPSPKGERHQCRRRPFLLHFRPAGASLGRNALMIQRPSRCWTC